MKKENNILILLIVLLLAYFLFFRKGNKIKNDQTQTSNDNIQKPAPEEEQKFRDYYNLIAKTLRDYQEYCKIKNWNFGFIISDKTIKNILTHFIIETGYFKYLHSNNFGNITAGNWKTKGAYNCSPYIKDFYNHNYIGTEIRPDKGVEGDKQEFRKYERPEDGIMDYLDLINRATRYKGISKLYDNEKPIFIKELGNAGYYTANQDEIYQTAINVRKNLD